MKNILTKLLAAILTMALTLAPLSGLAEDGVQEPEVAEAAVEEATEAVDDQDILDDQDIAAGDVDAEVSEDEFELYDDEDDGWSTEDFTADAAEVTPAGDQEPVEVPVEEPAEESAEEPAEEPTEETAEEPEKEPSEEPVEEASVEALEEVAETPAEEAAVTPASQPVVVAEDADTSAKLEEAAPAVAAEAAPGIPTQVVRNKAVVYLNKGDVLQLVVAGRTIRSCKSGKRKVASVSKTGLVTARKKGKTKITVNLKGKGKKKIVVTVKAVDPTLPRSVRITNGKVITMYKGETLQLNAVLAPETATSWLKWKSSKRKVATVSKSGVVYARKKGKTKITVRARNKKKYTVTVKVIKGWGSGTSGKVVVLTLQMLDAMAEAQIRLTNEERAKEGKAPLETDPELMAYAKVRAQELTRKFSHERPDGTSGRARIMEVRNCGAGENIAINYFKGNAEDSARAVTTQWVNSTKGHRQNMLRNDWRHIGVGVVVGSYGGSTALYWVQIFTTDPITFQTPEEFMAELRARVARDQENEKRVLRGEMTIDEAFPDAEFYASTRQGLRNQLDLMESVLNGEKGLCDIPDFLHEYIFKQVSQRVLSGELSAEVTFSHILNAERRLNDVVPDTEKNGEIRALLIGLMKQRVLNKEVSLTRYFPRSRLEYEDIREEITQAFQQLYPGESPEWPDR
ncbi:MAG: Ig-like domain-containing protein [Clostridia bacterium]|nr:Ig-like domain-containing protein [Clostridia bacterium]